MDIEQKLNDLLIGSQLYYKDEYDGMVLSVELFDDNILANIESIEQRYIGQLYLKNMITDIFISDDKKLYCSYEDGGQRKISPMYVTIVKPNSINYSTTKLSDIKAKTKVPDGTFTGKAETIKRKLMKVAKDKAHAKRMLTFYINRAGKNCKNKTELNKAKKLLDNCRDFSVLTEKLRAINFDNTVIDIEKSNELTKILAGKHVLAYPVDFGIVLSAKIEYESNNLTISVNTTKEKNFQIFQCYNLASANVGKIVNFELTNDNRLVINFESGVYESNIKYE